MSWVLQKFTCYHSLEIMHSDLSYVYDCFARVGSGRCTTHSYRGQKKTLDVPELKLQVVVSYVVDAGESNPGPLWEQRVILMAEPTVQLLPWRFYLTPPRDSVFYIGNKKFLLPDIQPCAVVIQIQGWSALWGIWWGHSLYLPSSVFPISETPRLLY